MFRIDRKSIAAKLTIIMLGIILLQSIVLICGLVVSGSTKSIKVNSYANFEKTVENRGDYLNNEMIYKWSNIISFTTEITSIYDEMRTEGYMYSDEDANMFLDRSAPTLINMLRATMATGAFIVLEGNDPKQESKSCVHIKDYDPVLNNDLNKDLYMVNGPSEVSRKFQIPLDSNWTYGSVFNAAQSDIYNRPFKAAVASAAGEELQLQQMGYWMISHDQNEVDNAVLTYSLPLLDGDGKPFGVMGIEISEKYLFQYLPTEELSESSLSGYMIGNYSEEKNDFSPLVSRGTVYSDVIHSGQSMRLEPVKEHPTVLRANWGEKGYKTVCHPTELKIYSSNSVYSDESLYLMGIEDEKGLLRPSNEFILSIAVAAFFSVALGGLFAFLAGIHFVKPILTLSNEVRHNDPQNLATFSKTGLTEIDGLSGAIETLNTDIVEKSLRTDKIISMANLPLGTFEASADEDYVKCSPVVISLLNLEDHVVRGSNVDKKAFFERIEAIKETPEPSEKDIYILKGNPNSWIQIVSLERENQILGVVVDVTKDVLEHYSIRFERDYDGLTGIYNRSAFNREAQKVFQGSCIQGEAAFIMFDLDNLKYINDTYGHETGDIYIKEAASVLSRYFDENSVLGRMSGDEFIIFIHSRESENQIQEIIGSFYDDLDNNLLLLPNGNQFKMRISGGLAWYRKDSVNFEELARFADFAMYEGKHTVKGEIREFRMDTYEKGSFMLSGNEELSKVLDNQLIEFAFQPIIVAKTGEIYAYESLMRPQSKILSTPLKLIQIATAQSRLWQIEKITMFKTLSTYKKYEKLFNGCKIFINSVPNEILKDSEYHMIEMDYADILDKIVIEIIENEKLDGGVLNLKKELVRSWGGAIALDDYGAGYNGDISMLSIAPQIVKIDKSMIDGIDVDRNRQSIVQKLLFYTKEQNILTVAEGVETKSQMEYLIGIGVDLLQGFYISRPEFRPEFDNKKIMREIKDIRSKL